MSQTFWSQYKLNPHGAVGSHDYSLARKTSYYGATEEKPSKGLAAIVIPLAMGWLLYEGFIKAKPAKKKSNPRRRKRNGTKKGQYRKTARRAYMKKRNGTKKGQRRKTARRAYSKRRR